MGKKLGALRPDHLAKIMNSKVLNRLIRNAEGNLNEGEEEMTPTQARVALALMDKVLPQLTAQELVVEGDITQTVAKINIVPTKVIDNNEC